MNRRLKLILPLAIAAAAVLAGSNIRFNDGCLCQAPIAFLGSILGCGGPGADTAPAVENAAPPEPAEEEGLQAAPAKNNAGPAKVTFVEIGSVNCIPCKMMQPVMKQIEEKYGSQVKIVFHDVWTPEGRPHGMKYGIRAIPTQVFLDKDGKEYFRHEGFFPFEEIEKVLKRKGVK